MWAGSSASTKNSMPRPIPEKMTTSTAPLHFADSTPAKSVTSPPPSPWAAKVTMIGCPAQATRAPTAPSPAIRNSFFSRSGLSPTGPAVPIRPAVLIVCSSLSSGWSDHRPARESRDTSDKRSRLPGSTSAPTALCRRTPVPLSRRSARRNEILRIRARDFADDFVVTGGTSPSIPSAALRLVARPRFVPYGTINSRAGKPDGLRYFRP